MPRGQREDSAGVRRHVSTQAVELKSHQRLEPNWLGPVRRAPALERIAVDEMTSGYVDEAPLRPIGKA